MTMLDVFQKHLDEISEALLTDDYDRYRAMVDVPLVVITEKATTIVTREEHFRYGFESYAGMLRTHQATDLIRLAHSVSEYGDNLITGRYETHILRGGKRIYGPFQSAATLVRVGGRWLINSVVSPVHGEEWPINRLPDEIDPPEPGGKG
jgi:hypothetical protein